ncbi:MAG: AbrB/MazE/SpoVT family DNA-binding domain-containing protein [Candidatus Korobacteraceae bacterium]
MEQGIRLRLNANGRVVIPASVRKELGVEAGDELILEKKDDSFVLTTQRHRIQRAQQRARKNLAAGASLADELIAERRKAAKSE